MPNTPALVGAGVFGIQEDPALPKDVFAMILDLFGLLGSTIVLPEKKFNAFMALVGCGPAYVFHFMDALAEAGVTMGFTRQEALELVTQLVLGSAKLAVLPGSHPAILREQVCSPAGVTIAAVNHLDRTAVRGHLIDAVLAAYEKRYPRAEKISHPPVAWKTARRNVFRDIYTADRRSANACGARLPVIP